MGTRVNGLMLEIEVKQMSLYGRRRVRRSHSAPPFYQGKKKFFAKGESSRMAAGNNNIKTLYDVPLMPDTRSVRRLQHSAEAICSELPQQSSHQYDQAFPPQVVVMVYSLMKGQM